mgnify:CR=1 FL=1
MRRVLYIKRKGFNYYTDYTELYLHRSFENYGYSLIREKEKSSFSVTVYISEDEKYMSFLSPFFDSLQEDDLSEICDNFSKAFKSEAIISICPDDTVFSGEKHIFMMSNKFSAFDEPIYLTNEKPKLKWKTADIFFRANNPYLISFVNVGGELSGVDIILDFDENTDRLIIDEAEIIYYENKKEIRKNITFTKDGDSFCANADFLHIEKGINPKSAVLRAKKLYTEEKKHGFHLKILPESYTDNVYTPTLRILNNVEEIFKQELSFPYNL